MKIKKILITIGGTFISAFAFNAFFSPYHIVPGGVGGLGIIANNLFSINESLAILIATVLLFLIGLIFLDKKTMLDTLFVSLLFPFFIYLTSLLFLKLNIIIDNKLLAAIAGGFLFGFGLGIIYREGLTTGGIDILTKIFNKYFNINYGVGTLILDGTITVIGAFIFGFETFLYSIVSIIIYSYIIDRVTLDLIGNKSFNIVTTKPDEVKDFILNDLHHGVTILNGKGAYTNEKKAVLFVAIPRKDYYKLKEGIRRIDNHAFFVVSSSYEVGGGK
jgi:uncharacterized membrane-anchored protein YitT (DUF2179 family)